MKEKITPCLWFNNQAKEAAALYCGHFPGAKIVSQSPIVTEIEIGGQHITLLDGGPMYKPNPSISLYYICETEEEIKNVWNAFSREGSVLMPLDKYPWSEQYGWLSDQFGISWQFVLGKVADMGQKITPAFLFVGDQYGRVDEAIEHFCAVFENTAVSNILRYGAGEQPDQEGKVKHAQVVLEGQNFILMESAHQHHFAFSEGISLTIHCETQKEIDHYWEKLTEKGEESMCGWLKDRFGISWQVIPSLLATIMSDPKKAGKAAQAFMQMRKFDIAQIVQATL